MRSLGSVTYSESPVLFFNLAYFCQQDCIFSPANRRLEKQYLCLNIGEHILVNRMIKKHSRNQKML